MSLVDTRGRTLRDLRISITDRCNFRCRYCMPREIFNREYEFLQRELLLSFEEITRLTRIFKTLGVEKVRITGGEPLLRNGVEELIAELAGVGIDDLTLTSNGSLLARKAEALAAAGLRRVTVSLDSLDPDVFAAMNDAGFPVSKVLDGIEAAAATGLTPVKVNMVVKRGVNDDGVLPMAEHFRGTGHIVRFIEFMDVGMSNGCQLRRRGRRKVALPGRSRGDRGHLVHFQTVLRRLHPGPALGRGCALHVPVCLRRR